MGARPAAAVAPAYAPPADSLHMMAGCPRCGHGLPKNTLARPSCSTEAPVG